MTPLFIVYLPVTVVTVMTIVDRPQKSKTSYASQCWDFAQKGFCPRGDACKWTHSQTPLHSFGPPDESQFCWDYQKTGKCPRGSQCRWIHELVLLPWPSPSLVPLPAPIMNSFEDPMGEGIPTTPEPYWDQFDENQRLFGTTSTYDPSMSAYTTPLVMDSLTADQIARAELLARVPLPSEQLSESNCVFCDKCFQDVSGLIPHVRELILQVLLGNLGQDNECEGTAQIRTLIKRKSWIILQETLPAGFVSQIESLYRRQVTSSTNLQMIIEAVRIGEGVSEDTREYLMHELVCLVGLLAQEAPRAVVDKKPSRSGNARPATQKISK